LETVLQRVLADVHWSWQSWNQCLSFQPLLRSPHILKRIQELTDGGLASIAQLF